MKPVGIILLLLLSLGIGFYAGSTYNIDQPIDTKEIDSLYNAIDSLSHNISRRDSNIVGLENRVEKLNNVNAANKAELQKLRKGLNNEITKVKAYSTTDISSFLNERYSTD